jgi:SOS response regulatory protein OraA/RecX
MNSRIYNYCIYLLARQDYSEFKLRKKLHSHKDNLPHEIDEVILKLKERGLLREENYRRLFIRKWMLKNESEDKIQKRGELENLIFDKSEFDHARLELGISKTDSIEKIIDKKLRNKKVPSDITEKIKLRDKTIRYLISKGHQYNDSKKHVDNYFKKHQSTDELSP